MTNGADENNVFEVNSKILDVCASCAQISTARDYVRTRTRSVSARPAGDKPTLDNFVVGANGEAVSVLREVAAGCGPTFVYLYGPKGAGLTHLLRSLVPEEGFRVPMFDPKVPLYVVDDVDELDPGWALQLLALQNAVRGTPGMHLVCAGRVPAAQLPLPEVVRSRLAWGLCYAIRPLDDEERLAELHRQAARRGIELTPDILHWMGANLPRDMRTLTCVLDEADRLGLQKQRRVTLPLLREAVTSLDERQHARQAY